MSLFLYQRCDDIYVVVSLYDCLLFWSCVEICIIGWNTTLLWGQVWKLETQKIYFSETEAVFFLVDGKKKKHKSSFQHKIREQEVNDKFRSKDPDHTYETQNFIPERWYGKKLYTVNIYPQLLEHICRRY